MTRRHSSLISPVLGCAAIAVALYTILFAGVRNFDVEDAERILTELASHLAEESANRGKETKLQYSNVEIRGFGYDKWARISNLSLDFIYQQWQGGTRFSISTEGADLIPDHANRDRIVARFGERLNLISGSDLLAMIQPAKPILYSLSSKLAEAPEVVKHRIYIPGNIGITMLDPKRELLLQLANPVQAEIAFYQSQHQLRTQITSGTIKALTGQGIWHIGTADIRYDSLQKSARVIESKGTLTLDDLSFSRSLDGRDSFTATAAWSMKDQRNISGATDESQLLIEHGLLTNGEIKMSVNGAVNFDIDDSAYGEIVIEINNPPALLKSSLIAEDKRELAASLLGEIMGEPVESHRQVLITITRAKNNQWQVGKLPLDALLAKGFLSLFTFMEPSITHDENNPEETIPPPA